MLEDDNVYVVVSSDQLNPILKAFGHEKKLQKCFDNWRWKYRFAISKDVRGKF